MRWIDQYTGKLYRITTNGSHGSRLSARVKTYGETVSEYAFHPEAKCADVDGNEGDKQTVGLLQRRHVAIDHIRYIGKESNRLEDVEAGLVHSELAAYTEYPDPRHDQWETQVLPLLKTVPASVVANMTSRSAERLCTRGMAGDRIPKTAM